jgi:flagellar biosynthesis protein FlhB
MIERFADRAEKASLPSLLITMLCALILLILPVCYTLLRQAPHELCARFYSYEVTGQSFTVTRESVVFRGGESILAAQRDFFPDEDIEGGDWAEVFDRLALLNHYYRDMLLPIMLLLSLMNILMLLSLTGMLAGLMGLTRKLSHALPFAKRLRIFAACSWIPALPALLVGFFLPVFHIFVYQLLLGYLAWKTQKLL